MMSTSHIVDRHRIELHLVVNKEGQHHRVLDMIAMLESDFK